MKREFLEELGLEQEVVEKIMAENGKDVQAEQAKTTAAETKATKLETQLTSANETIKSYKDMDIEKIKESATEWETKAGDLEKELTQVRNEALLDKELSTVNTHDMETLKKLLNHEELIFKDGEVVGLKEQIAGLRESKAYLFKETKDPETKDPEDNRFDVYKAPDGAGGAKSVVETQLDTIFNI
ncbi:MAG: hypothetical protein GXZ11_03115 [Tissierellia bacterium]|nr:hypothetical protein [Tissierellia bacterium]